MVSESLLNQKLDTTKHCALSNKNIIRLIGRGEKKEEGK